jgi:prepilin-type N-terminal cleavage/methylation domain-containing protein
VKTRTPSEGGMSLIEMMIALVIFSIIMAGSLSFLTKQSQGFDRSSSEMGMLQNLRFSISILRQEIRMAGANMPPAQPAVVYAGTTSFAFNADYTSNTDSLFTVYYDPGVPTGQSDAIPATRRMTIPGSSPAFQYPDSTYVDVNGNNSAAETIIWFFTVDTTTGDYTLDRQVNDGAPEIVVRNIVPTPGANFFKYYYRHAPTSGAASLDSVPTAWVPLSHSVPLHGDIADTGAAARIDSLRAVEVTFTVTNGMTGTDLRTRSISFTISMPNVGLVTPVICGHAPILGTTLSAVWSIDSSDTPYDTTMQLTWSPATDEVGGEHDVVRYVLWRRLVGASVWGEPRASVSAGNPSPAWTDEAAVPGPPGYQYALAAQDCTPSLSSLATVNAPLSP